METYLGIRVPTTVTLKKYGFSKWRWRKWIQLQGGLCAVCGRKPGSGRLVFDHEHVPGWKKMPPEERRLYVRGFVCWYCNHAYLGRGITVEIAEGVLRYLRKYARRRP